MTLPELTRKIREVEQRGYITTLRNGDTGVGYTFETIMELPETNIPVPDLGGRVELKTTRSNATSLKTMFCFNRAVWQIPQKEFLRRYGYYDPIKQRQACYVNIAYEGINLPDEVQEEEVPCVQQKEYKKLKLQIDEEGSTLHLVNELNESIAIWDIYVIIAKLLTKMARVLFVRAENRRTENGVEEFHYNEFYLLTEPNRHTFFNAFRNGDVIINTRMHLKPNGTVRNRGTAFRVNLANLYNLYGNRRSLL